MAVPRSTMRRYVALVVACLCMSLVGSYLLVSIMSNDMGREFNLTTTAVEIIVGTGSAAGNIGYPWGLALEHMSERNSFIMSLVMGSACSFALYAGDYFLHFYAVNWWLIAILWGGVCSSFVITYIQAIGVSLRNFPPNRHGLVMAVLAAVWSMGQAFFNYVYTVVLQHHPTRIGKIFLVLGVCIFVFESLAAIFVRPIKLDPDEESKLLDPEVKNKTASDKNLKEAERKSETWAEIFGLELLCDLDFHLTLWGFLCGVSVQTMYISNVSGICWTLGLGTISESILPYAPLFGMACTFTMGFLSDRTLNYFPRQSYLAIAAGFQTILFGLSTVYADSAVVFKATVLLIFGFNAVYYALTGTIISDYFGMKHFRRNWGVTIMCGALVAFLLTTVYGTLLDAEVNVDGSQCVGLVCLKNIFIIGGFLSFMSFIALVWLHRRFLKEKAIKSGKEDL